MAKKQVDLHHAKTHLSALVDEAASGKEIVIVRGGRPAAKLVRVDEPKRKLVYGRLKGRVKSLRTSMRRCLPSFKLRSKAADAPLLDTHESSSK